MPDQDLAAQRKITAIVNSLGGRKLTAKELLALPKAPPCHAAWEKETDIQYQGQNIVLHLRFAGPIESTLPDVYVASPTINPGELPHVENEGKLCVWPAHYIIDVNNIGYITELLDDAESLLRRATSGELSKDFINEFNSYWDFGRGNSTRVSSFCQLRSHAKKQRKIFCYRSAKGSEIIFADSREELICCLENKSILPIKKDCKDKARDRLEASIQFSILIWISNPWIPSEYPKTVGELFSLLSKDFTSDEFSELKTSLGNVLGQNNANNVILIGFSTEHGNCVVAVRVEESLTNYYRDRYRTESMQRGAFGKHSISDGYRTNIDLRAFENRIKNVKIERLYVNRCDNDWVLGREHNHQIHTINKHCIAIIGCGSIGAAVARLLLQSGIAHLQLWDNDVLYSENCSRHLLGLSSIRMSKVDGLAKRLREDFPFVKIETFGKHWSSAVDDAMRLEEAEIILNCTADWVTHKDLLSWQESNSGGTIIFSYVEAHAIAGHVIVNPLGSNAFNAWHVMKGDRVGQALVPATEWPNETMKQVPACAGAFQPYGAIPLTHIHSLTAEMVLDLILLEDESDIKPMAKSWLGRQSDLNKLGGQWGHEWISRYGNPENGERVVSLHYIDDQWKMV